MPRVCSIAILLLLSAALLACGSTPQRTHQEQWQLGSDYIELSTRLNAAAESGNVNVTIYFVTTAPYWQKFRPELYRWLESKPAYINCTLSPAIVFPNARSQTRAFLTLRQMGRDDLFDKLFDWILQEDHYPVYHTVMHPDDPGMARLSSEFAKANSLDVGKFETIYSAAEMDERVALAEIETHFTAASTVVVNGRLATEASRIARTRPSEVGTPENSQRLFKLVEYLAAREREGAT